ncbi:DUF2982 domain-containing protein [Aliiglaciecola sp. M165]|uniref:DUF2982 domain-containing protein n=1 Tax=Aliiglaciecola sp. M165 TaxID=2593649 RepID=UPI00117F0CC4|nr:DUF2982 domain-containing protein [Aliiglaciecola sp. M165]TRY31421.1 DUF2982 domain-containing protein [Aliiglaciecola sp. M165]
MSGNENNTINKDASQTQSIKIRAASKRNGLTTFIVGVGVLFVAILLLIVLPKAVYLIGIFALSGSIVTMLIGWFKMREPPHSIELTKRFIHYQHRHGKWQLDWDNIQRIDVPKISQGIEQIPLSMVGIRIKDYQPLLDSISPRLATNLLLEQRALLLHNSGCATGGCYNNDLIEDDRFKMPDGTIVQGIPAMLANRMSKLRNSLGFDLFISVAELDRSSEEFVALLKQCHINVLQELP